MLFRSGMENNVARKPKTGEVKMVDDPAEALNPGLDAAPEAAPAPAPEAAPEAAPAPAPAPETVAEAAPEPVAEAAPAPVVVEIVTHDEVVAPELPAQTLLEMEAGRRTLALRTGR